MNTIKLSAFNIPEGSATVSGISSGGMMAVQVHVAFSAMVNGSGVFAGGPYHCAEGNLFEAVDECMYAKFGGPKTAKLVQYTRNEAARGAIDNPANLKDDKVYLFSGTEDSVVNPKVMFALQDYYDEFIDPANIISKFDLKAEHTWPTLAYGNPCTELSSPYMGSCNYDGSGKVMSAMYADLRPPGAYKIENLMKFDQTEHFSGHISVDSTGFIYIPTDCADRATPCKLHVAIHGCQQGQSFVGSEYAEHNGLNEWAEANNVVVIYPNVIPDSALGNPDGCWDWWGYLGRADYALQSGPQMAFMKSILDTVLGVSK